MERDFQVHVGRQFKVGKTLPKYFLAEVGIETAVDFDALRERHLRHVVLFGNDEDVLQGLRTAL
jgi:hypothetical protein